MGQNARAAALRETEPDFALSEADALEERFEELRGGAFNLRYIVSTIRANLWLIIAILVASLALAVGYTMLQTPRYIATATIQINDQGDRVLEKGQETMVSGDGYDTDRFLQTQIDILSSRGLAQRVSESLRLSGDPSFFTGLEAQPPAQGTPAHVVRDMTVGMLKGNFSAKLPRNSRVIGLSFNSADPELSARMANGYAKEFIAANLQRKYDSSAYARTFVSGQLTEAKRKLEISERELNAYARNAGLVRTAVSLDKEEGESSAGSVTAESLVQLNRAANDARTARIAVEGRWRAISGRSPLASPDALSNGSIQALLQNRSELRSKLQLERAKHLDGHPNVIQLNAQAAENERLLANMIATVRGSVKSQFDAAVASERDLVDQVAALKGDTLQEQDKAVQYNILAREANTNRILYDGLLQRFKELNAAAGISSSNVSIIDMADPPSGPSSPNLMMNLAVALIIGTALAAVTLIIRDQFDDSVRVPEDVEHKLHLPLLGVIPHSDEDPQAALSDPKSAISEAYSSLGGSLLYSTSEGLPHVMLVTSAQPTEGKSTTCYAIAAGLARIGRRVVLIDADLRRPSLHRRTGIDNSKGLIALLTSQAPIETSVIPSPQAGLDLVPSGPVPPNPSDLIASLRMHALIEEFADKYDVVIIDSPPILGLADAPLMSALTDGVVLVIEADRSRRGQLKASLRRLRAMRPNLLGAALTKYDTKKFSNSYSDYYGYDYYQYKSEDGKTRRRSRKAA